MDADESMASGEHGVKHDRECEECCNVNCPYYDMDEEEEKKDDEIIVGDEVLNNWGTKGIVIEIAPQHNSSTIYSVLWRNAERKCWDKSDWKDNQVWKKTGRYFPQIIEALTKIQEDE